MLKLCGEIINVYKAPDFKPKDGGDLKEGAHKIQILHELLMSNGEMKKELVTLTCKDPDAYMPGEKAEVVVGYFARGGQVSFYAM